MKEQFNTFKQTFLENTLDHLWNQWSILGVAGAGDTRDLGIVDPEALILLSIELAEQDLRLFDEMLSWLVANGELINTKRLLKLHDQYQFLSNRILAGMAEHISGNHVNWKRLVNLDYSGEEEVHWLPVNTSKKNMDPRFARHAVHRSVFKDRGLSSRFNFTHPHAILPRLRSLLGMNAHCEILCYFSDGRRVHASKAARDLAYSQKAIQETLVSMEKVAGVTSYQEGKTKLYSLNQSLWQSLIPNDVKWTNPIEKYALTKDVWRLLHKYQPDSENIQLTATLIKNEYLTWKIKYPAFYDSSLEHETDKMFLEKWMQLVSDLVSTHYTS
ncbi:MAG: hypothetical protein ACI9E1_002068 [Cryomorphaceae bacterium]|jgi:hypothetical protein